MAAMQAMGKLKNPLTDKIEKDLNQAQFSIDVLDMLKEKTKGNLNDYESRFLENILGQLKLNFIDEKNKESKPEDEKNKESKPEDEKK